MLYKMLYKPTIHTAFPAMLALLLLSSLSACSDSKKKIELPETCHHFLTDTHEIMEVIKEAYKFDPQINGILLRQYQALVGADPKASLMHIAHTMSQDELVDHCDQKRYENETMRAALTMEHYVE